MNNFKVIDSLRELTLLKIELNGMINDICDRPDISDSYKEYLLERWEKQALKIDTVRDIILENTMSWEG